jgi:hypothetical protein
MSRSETQSPCLPSSPVPAKSSHICSHHGHFLSQGHGTIFTGTITVASYPRSYLQPSSTWTRGTFLKIHIWPHQASFPKLYFPVSWAWSPLERREQRDSFFHYPVPGALPTSSRGPLCSLFSCPPSGLVFSIHSSQTPFLLSCAWDSQCLLFWVTLTHSSCLTVFSSLSIVLCGIPQCSEQVPWHQKTVVLFLVVFWNSLFSSWIVNIYRLG